MVMRKRQEAPGQLELVRAFVNTRDIEAGTDDLAGPDELASWLQGHGLADAEVTADQGDLRRALALREALREILLSHTDGTQPASTATRILDEIAVRARLALRFDAAGVAAVRPTGGGVEAALGRLLAVAHAAMADGTWDRLKACRDHGCEWAFYDHTKNHSGAWCTMDVCGNRAKARAYRERRPAAAPLDA
jgi:predicted RNA-binding Zn ribbon-like protein